MKETDEVDMFFRAWKAMPCAEGFRNYSVEKMPVPELVEKMFPGGKFTFEYVVTCKGTRVYRCKTDTVDMFLHYEGKLGVINGHFDEACNRIIQMSEVD